MCVPTTNKRRTTQEAEGQRGRGAEGQRRQGAAERDRMDAAGERRLRKCEGVGGGRVWARHALVAQRHCCRK